MIFSIDFVPGYYNGNMQLTVRVDGHDQATWCSHESQLRDCVSFQYPVKMDQAFKLDLIFSGKNQNKDTLLVDGVMTADKFIRINSIQIGPIKLQHELFLFDFHTENHGIITRTNYFGFNGIYTLDITPDLPSWLIMCSARLQPTVTQSWHDFVSEIMS